MYGESEYFLCMQGQLPCQLDGIQQLDDIVKGSYANYMQVVVADVVAANAGW
jgi:hypothetical protein